MKASVVIPVYNKAPYLEECLASVFSQSFTDYEVIAVDDASTDGSLALLEAVQDPRLRVIRSDRNVGPGGAAQRGIDAARGEYIIRVDADDVMMPERFAQQVALLDADPTLGAISGHIQLMGKEQVVHKVELDDADCKAALLFGVALNQPASAYRRSVLVDHGIRYEDEWSKYGEDWLYQLRLARVTRFRNVDTPLIRYRKGAMNIAHGRDRGADLRALYIKVFKDLGIPISEAELEVHPYGVKFFGVPPTAAHVQRFHAWLQRLAKLHEQVAVFDTKAVERKLRRVWDELFYQLPAYGKGPTMAYLRFPEAWSLRKLYYLVATWKQMGERTEASR